MVELCPLSRSAREFSNSIQHPDTDYRMASLSIHSTGRRPDPPKPVADLPADEEKNKKQQKNKTKKQAGI